jgi:hypothetical protein
VKIKTAFEAVVLIVNLPSDQFAPFVVPLLKQMLWEVQI